MSGRPFPSLKEKFIDGFQTESLRSVTETRVNKLRGPTPCYCCRFHILVILVSLKWLEVHPCT